MKPLSMFRHYARKGATHEAIRARYLESGMTHDMADLLITLTGIHDMPREERHTTPAGRSLWIKYMAGCAMVENDFEAFARNKAFDEFRRELHRLVALVAEERQRTEARHDGR